MGDLARDQSGKTALDRETGKHGNRDTERVGTKPRRAEVACKEDRRAKTESQLGDRKAADAEAAAQEAGTQIAAHASGPGSGSGTLPAIGNFVRFIAPRGQITAGRSNSGSAGGRKRIARPRKAAGPSNRA